MTTSYICEVCAGEYEKVFTDEEAVANFKEEFPEWLGDTTDCALICDDCYKEYMKRIPTNE